MNNADVYRKKQKRPRLIGLEVIRALAFIGVFTHHTGLTHLGRGSVSVFFALSGFLMIYSYYDKNIQYSLVGSVRFMWDRIKKLYPLYLVSLITMIPHLLIEDVTFSSKIIRLIVNTLFIQTYIPSDGGYMEEISASMNGPVWYLSTLTLLYFLFPLVLKKIQSYTNNNKAIVAIFSSIIAMSVIAILELILEKNTYYTGSWLTYMSPVGRFWDFYIGCNLGYLFIKNKIKVNEWKATFLEVVSITLFFVTVIIRVYGTGVLSSKYLISLAYIIPVILLVYTFAIGQGKITKLLNNKVTNYLSSISAIGFIIHFPIISYVNFSLVFIFKETPSIILLSVLSFTLVVITSEIYKKLDTMLQHKNKTKIITN